MTRKRTSPPYVMVKDAKSIEQRKNTEQQDGSNKFLTKARLSE
jgi:hypothetical protein